MTSDIDKLPGHWLLAKMGKSVLRPGGRLLTKRLLEELSINQDDDIVEIAPGLGFTAQMALTYYPRTYIGIDFQKQAVESTSKRLNSNKVRIIKAHVEQTTLESNKYNKVFGEAYLTLHADHRKAIILKEIYRILTSGGFLGIHELALKPDSLKESMKDQIKKDLAKSVLVNVRPLTKQEWVSLLEQNGFSVKQIVERPMLLLEPRRILEDEVLFRTLKIIFNLLRQPKALRRVLGMQTVFKRYKRNMQAIMIVAEKNTST